MNYIVYFYVTITTQHNISTSFWFSLHTSCIWHYNTKKYNCIPSRHNTSPDTNRVILTILSLQRAYVLWSTTPSSNSIRVINLRTVVSHHMMINLQLKFNIVLFQYNSLSLVYSLFPPLLLVLTILRLMVVDVITFMLPTSSR